MRLDERKVMRIWTLMQVILVSLKTLKVIKKKKKALRRWWVKPHIVPRIRNIIGAFATVCQYLQINDHEEFTNQFKMTPGNFQELYTLIADQLQKQYHIREPISAYIRLAITIHYFVQGGNALTYCAHYRIGKATFFKIIHETCYVITSVLLPIYVKFPNERDWLRIAQEFEDRWNFPNCVGALDGKHMRIKRPAHAGSVFYNYKKFHSLVLIAISDAQSRFVWFTLGDGGSFSDSSVFQNTNFYNKILNNELNLPAPTKLPNSDRSSPFVIVADEIFGLGFNLMKPYNRRLLQSNQERIFNYRLSRARFTIERAFGILCAKFQLLNSALAHNLDKNKLIISACLVLHNFLITKNVINVDDDFRHLDRQINQNVMRNPIFIRQNLAEYFSNEGAVPWQNNYI
ncbi:uncharacterized protein LOC131669245 [Phymastichus coffea]|uniref:uncharacterized protein LOC131668154 n=1 Tax=Phymastichus coffea TaxID=108790 RepID=UPI00273B7688|nr:uncharacterized protein LOC131665896 isoform X1 [Phymastichus coffea]XP_058794108.1 uncharacterized protein LOC131665896 isoform X1 [Phymastichus coffea]XP_058794109.1 uncharacterized protein LOC131665896 isoform X1 [Phymastichus coffea]XP_058794110.1 uncharacterized protein LOC131665896 isoform X1 [Phymastichus coffea]XP_058794111.1 uncharacterized protein LOC131665896 isoform X1 [Phymastichus coffea]XP_058794112.1 uncharacterized protein LOC131665896 isoform X1 [Phymastichus coffea]XP_05